MRNNSIFIFIFSMWILLLFGGGVVVIVLGPITITGYGELNSIIASGIKAVIAIILVVIWIFILLKMKNRIFQKQIQS